MTDKLSAKQRALLAIERLPDDCSWEDIMYELYVLAKIDAGMADIEAGRIISHEEIKREFAEWQQSVGLQRLG